jgi:hypothetical protein
MMRVMLRVRPAIKEGAANKVEDQMAMHGGPAPWHAIGNGLLPHVEAFCFLGSTRIISLRFPLPAHIIDSTRQEEI